MQKSGDSACLHCSQQAQNKENLIQHYSTPNILRFQIAELLTRFDTNYRIIIVHTVET
jgi:hypothetical protein